MTVKKLNFDEVTFKIMDECEEKKWEWCCAKPVSEHPDDWYLAYCVVINNYEEAVFYTFNAELGGFHHGHYFGKDGLKNAMNYFDER